MYEQTSFEASEASLTLDLKLLEEDELWKPLTSGMSQEMSSSSCLE